MPDGWVKEFAPAKINLTLHVTGQRADGYHLLDSLVVFADVGDFVRLRPAKEMKLTVTGPMAGKVPAHAQNLVWKAATWFGAPPVEIVLEKNLPSASGIGGGSADAAATLRALSRLLDMPLPDAETTAKLGADVPVCIIGRPCRMRGIGDEVDLLDGLPGLHVLLVNPAVPLATPTVFNALSSKENPMMVLAPNEWVSARDLLIWADGQRNDLEAPAVQMQPIVRDVIQELRTCGAPLVRMSGSGATCFAASHKQSDIARAEVLIRQNFPNFWVARGQTFGSN